MATSRPYEQFTCDTCGLPHPVSEKINFADMKLCSVCMAGILDEAAELAAQEEVASA